ncbi:GNAT family N-acetyltransferase [Longispora urticae]
MRTLEPTDLGLLLELQERVRSGLADPGVFQTSTPEFLSYCLDGGGRCYGVRHGPETVAYRLVYYPRDREFNLARDSALPPGEHGLVAHWDTIAVLPDWRGHGLARLLNTTALRDVAGTGLRHLFATSAPGNPHGIGSLLSAGFRPVRLVRKFGGRLRFLLYRPNPGDWPAAPTGLDVPLHATGDLEQAFGDGWVGVALTGEGPAVRLRMARQAVPYHS